MNTEEILKREYADYLTANELELAISFYNITQNKEKTFVICDDMKKAFYGKTFNETSVKAINAINEEIAKCVILKLIGRSEEYFEKLPVDIQDTMFELYEKYLDEEQLQTELCSLLEIKKPALPKQEQPSHQNANTSESTEKKSLLAKLKYYQDKLNDKKIRG